MQRIIKLLAQAKESYASDSLFRNAVLLMSSTAIMSVLGFVFWIFIAHLYSPAMIGEASALISITTLISNVSLLGLNAGLVRFLPKSKNQSSDINTAIITVGATTIIAASVYLLVSSLFDVHIPLLSTPIHQIAFVVLMSTVSLNSLTDAVFIANRRAEFHTIGYATLGSVKLILPLFLIPFGSLGIFMAYILAVIASLILSLFFMRRYINYRIDARPNWSLLKQTRKYTTNNYIAVIVAGLPSQLMPLFIIKELGTAQVAYFAMAWTMANLLFVIPTASTQSLLAESSHDTSQKGAHLKHTIKLLSSVLIPGVFFTILAAPYILKIFGEQYSTGSTVIFQLFAFSTFFVTINAIGNTILNIERRTSGIVIAQVTGLVVTFLSVLFLVRYGLRGIGLAMLLGVIASNICLLFILRYNRRHPLPSTANIDTSAVIFDATYDTIAPILATYGITTFKFQQLHSGSSSYTFLIRDSSGVKVLRIYKFNKKTDYEIEDELDFMHYLLSKGLTVPRTIADTDDHLLSRTTVNDVSWQHILMHYEKGKHPTSYSTKLLQQMARIQAHIHLYGIIYAKERKEVTHTKNKTRSKLLSFIFLSTPKGFSHFDFDASNILVEEEKVLTLDFEGARYDTLLSCLFFTLTRIYSVQAGREELELYIQEYQQVRPLTRIERRLLRLSLFLHYRSPRLLFISLQ